MKILITGATGFAGGRILRYLAEKYGKATIWGTGRKMEVIRAMREQGYQMIQGDLIDADFVSSTFQDFTHVVHCAAKASLWGSYDSFVGPNIHATQHILSGIPHMQKIIYISTPSIYFDFSDRLDIREDDPLPKRFVNAYAATKYKAEKEVLGWKKEGLQKVVFRPRAIIGAGDTVVMPRVIRASKTDRLRIIGKGKNIADFTSVENLAYAVDLALNAGKEIDGEVFNITDGQPLALWPLLQETLKKLDLKHELSRMPYPIALTAASLSEWYHKTFTKEEPVLTRYGIGILNYSLTMNIEKARRLLAYNPQLGTVESVDEFIKWYKA